MVDKVQLKEAVAKMRTAIDEFGEALEGSGIQWESYKMDDKVRAIYSLCNVTVNHLEFALKQLSDVEGSSQAPWPSQPTPRNQS